MATTRTGETYLNSVINPTQESHHCCLFGHGQGAALTSVSPLLTLRPRAGGCTDQCLTIVDTLATGQGLH